MKILLVYPKCPETFWSFTHALPFVGKKAVSPPLGLLTVAAMLPEKWEKKLIDENVEELTDNHIAWADIAFISAMIIQKGSALKIIQRCKLQNKKVVAGGPLFSGQPELFKDVDHLILNEAEITLRPFLLDLELGRAQHIYTSGKKPNLSDDSQTPLWSLIKFGNYVSMSVQFSRGCPHNCDFCDIIAMFGRSPRTKTSDQIIMELEALYKMGWRGSVFFADDNFIGLRKKTVELLKRLIEWQEKHRLLYCFPPFKFITQADVRLADDEELMNLMSQANFTKVFVGLESPSVNSLKECHKNQNISKDLEEVVRKIQNHGLQVIGGHIVGFDSDKYQSIFWEQFKFIQNNGIVVAMLGLLNAMPKTPLWDKLKKEGRIINESSGENTGVGINFHTVMNRDELIKGYKELVAKIYSPRNYYKRIEIFVKNYNPKDKSLISLNEIKAFIKSVWQIGIFSEKRKLYWKLLIKTFFSAKIKAFPEVVELTIEHIHLQKISEIISKA
jgi:radical SAM superfamily enzyme YgiQ (UPF0313 family)